MANVLRELIARVVLRVDDASLQRLDTKLDQARAKLTEFQTKAERGTEVKVDVNSTEAERSLSAIRVALGEMGSEVDTTAAQAELNAVSQAAEEVRADVGRIKTADPSNPRLGVLGQQLDAVGDEAKQTAVELGRAKQAVDNVGASSGKAAGMLGQFRGMLGGLGIAVGAAGLVTLVHQTLEAAGAVEDLADRLGMGIEEVQVWSAFAKRGGADTEALSASMKGLANAMQGAANGGKEQRAAFEALGISTDNWKKGLPSLTETLALVGGRLGEVDNEGQRLALTQKLLSEGGLKLAPAFKGGTKAVQEQLEKLKELAVVYDEDFVKSAGEAGDELDLFKAQFSGLGSEMILTFLPVLRNVVTTMTPFIRGIREAFKSSEIFKGILGATGITALSSLGGISGILAKIGPILKRLAVAAAPFLWAFAKFALLALIIDDLWVALNGGRSVIGDVLNKFDAGKAILEAFQMGFKLLKGTVLSVWGALSGDKDAVAKGAALLDQYANWIKKVGDNIKFAWNHLWNHDIPDLLTKGLTAADDFLREKFGAMYQFLIDWGKMLAGALGAIWDGLIDGLKGAIAAAGDLIGKIPGVGSLIGDDKPDENGKPDDKGSPVDNAKAALETGATPTVPGSNSNSSVTINNNQKIETNISGGQPREVVAAVASAEAKIVAATKNTAKTYRHVVGATR